MEKPTPPRVQMGPHLPLFLPGSSDDEGINYFGRGPPVSRSASDGSRSTSEEPRSQNRVPTNPPVSALSDSEESSGEQEFGVGFPPSSDSGKSSYWCNSGAGSLSASGESDGYTNCGVGSPSGPLSSSGESDSPGNFGVGSPSGPLSSSGESDGPGDYNVGSYLEISDFEESEDPSEFGAGSHSASLSDSEESEGPRNFGVGLPIEFSDSEESDGRDDFHANTPVSLLASEDSKGESDFMRPLPTLINLYCSRYTRLPATFTGMQRFPPPPLPYKREESFWGGHSCLPIAFSGFGSFRWRWKLLKSGW